MKPETYAQNIGVGVDRSRLLLKPLTKRQKNDHYYWLPVDLTQSAPRSKETGLRASLI